VRRREEDEMVMHQPPRQGRHGRDRDPPGEQFGDENMYMRDPMGRGGRMVGPHYDDEAGGEPSAAAYEQLSILCKDLESEQRMLREQLEDQQQTIARLESEQDLHANAGASAKGGAAIGASPSGNRRRRTRAQSEKGRTRELDATADLPERPQSIAVRTRAKLAAAKEEEAKRKPKVKVAFGGRAAPTKPRQAKPRETRAHKRAAMSGGENKDPGADAAGGAALGGAGGRGRGRGRGKVPGLEAGAVRRGGREEDDVPLSARSMALASRGPVPKGARAAKAAGGGGARGRGRGRADGAAYAPNPHSPAGGPLPDGPELGGPDLGDGELQAVSHFHPVSDGEVVERDQLDQLMSRVRA